MSMSEQIFSITREDLVFNVEKNLEEIVQFSPMESEPATPGHGIRKTESLGFDFQNECSPIIEIFPFNQNMMEELALELTDLMLNITLEDTGLAIRKVIYSISISDISEKTRLKINLKEQLDIKEVP